jgi:hypothetical protein
MGEHIPALLAGGHATIVEKSMSKIDTNADFLFILHTYSCFTLILTGTFCENTPRRLRAVDKWHGAKTAYSVFQPRPLTKLPLQIVVVNAAGHPFWKKWKLSTGTFRYRL